MCLYVLVVVSSGELPKSDSRIRDVFSPEKARKREEHSEGKREEWQYCIVYLEPGKAVVERQGWIKVGLLFRQNGRAFAR